MTEKPVTTMADRITALRELLERESERWQEWIPFDTLPQCPPDTHDWIVAPEVYRDEAGITLSRFCAKCDRRDEAVLWFAELEHGGRALDLYAKVHRIIVAGGIRELERIVDALYQQHVPADGVA